MADATLEKIALPEDDKYLNRTAAERLVVKLLRLSSELKPRVTMGIPDGFDSSGNPLWLREKVDRWVARFKAGQVRLNPRQMVESASPASGKRPPSGRN